MSVRRAKPIELLMPSEAFFTANESVIFLNYHFIVVMSIPSSIHDFYLKYLEINDSLFSQEQQIPTCLQQHLKPLYSVPNSLHMSPHKPCLIPFPVSLPLSNLENVWAAQHFLLSSNIVRVENFTTFMSSFCCERPANFPP
jgi:hypothetical protein